MYPDKFLEEIPMKTKNSFSTYLKKFMNCDSWKLSNLFSSF